MYSLHSVTFSDSQYVNHLRLLEDWIDSDFFFEQVVGEIDFLSGVSSVDLDFHDVVFLLSEVQQLHLSGSDDSNDSTVFLNSV